MNILVATNHLSNLGGSETFTYTLIEELIKREGILVEYFTFRKGIVSQRIEMDLGVKFKSKNSYDLILANHNTCVDRLYSLGFIIQTCHGIFPKLEQPSLNADAYVAISQEVQSYLASKNLPSQIINNGINLNRFKLINPLQKKLTTVLSLCHSQRANNFIQDVCNELGVKLIIAYKFDNRIWDVQNYINKADVVIGLGRSAYESFACGRPVVIYDDRIYFESCGDGYAKEILGFSLKNNCSGRYLRKKFSKQELIDELKKYDHLDSDYFREIACREFDIKKSVDQYLGYLNMIKENGKFIRRQKWITALKFTLGVTTYSGLRRVKNFF